MSKLQEWGTLIREKWKNVLLFLVIVPLIPFFYLYECGVRYLRPLNKWLVNKYDEKFVQPPRDLLTAKEIEERLARRKARNAIGLLPAARPRALTLGSEEMEPGGLAGLGHETANELSKRRTWRIKKSASTPKPILLQYTTNQVAVSPFYKLPYEIRDCIWRYALGGHHIHIVRRKGRLGNVFCPVHDPTHDYRRDLCLHSRDWQGFYRATAWPPDMKPLGLIMSCRQIYSESIDYLYSLNTFSFDDFDLIPIFFVNLLPHRRNLLSYIHISTSYTTRRLIIPRPFTHMFAPVNSIEDFSNTANVLNMLPKLQTLTITPAFALDQPHSLPAGSISRFFDHVDEIEVSGQCTVCVPWPESSNVNSNPYTSAWTVSDNLLERHRRFSVKHMPTAPQYRFISVLAFMFPFNVRCLHCQQPTIIRKATRGLAEHALHRVEPIFRHNFPLPEPLTSYYWTFHTLCGGWLEFTYTWANMVWAVTQGGIEITDEEAAVHLSQNKGRYQELENPHERLQGLSVIPHPTETGGWDWSGRAIDVPTKETFYRNVGWARD